jgi:hypothetical protein
VPSSRRLRLGLRSLMSLFVCLSERLRGRNFSALRGACAFVVVALLGLGGVGLLPGSAGVALAAEVNTCDRQGDLGGGFYDACEGSDGDTWGTFIDASAITDPSLLVLGCVGSSLSAGGSDGGDPNGSCGGAGGTIRYDHASVYASPSFGLVYSSDGFWYTLAGAGYMGGSTSPPPSSAPAAFDVSQLDPASLTAYFSWGWFIVATGWVIGKGVSMFVRFVRSV